jgi:hypothetical protein
VQISREISMFILLALLQWVFKTNLIERGDGGGRRHESDVCG